MTPNAPARIAVSLGAESDALMGRYADALLPVFGQPALALSHGSGARVVDVDGTSYLDLLGGIAVNSLGHAHPDLVAAIADQAGRLLHISNFFTSAEQVALAERLLAIAGAPEGSAVFLANSGTEAVEAVVKLARRTGRPRILAVSGSFHGRSTGALALTHKAAYREPFEPLIAGVSHLEFGSLEALESGLDESVAALVLEPIQGEAGVIPATDEYLRAARDLTARHGILLVLDEIQSGVGRTGDWFAHTRSGIRPDAMVLAKGLAGGVPIGAMLTYGEQVTALLGAGQHGSTFGGNPLAARAALTVLDVIERDGLTAHARAVGEHLTDSVLGLRHPDIDHVRGRGLLVGIGLRRPIAAGAVAAARAAGFIVNAPNRDTIRLAPPLVISQAELDEFVAALPGILDRSTEG